MSIFHNRAARKKTASSIAGAQAVQPLLAKQLNVALQWALLHNRFVCRVSSIEKEGQPAFEGSAGVAVIVKCWPSSSSAVKL